MIASSEVHFAHRPEIDGLRAFAVLPVILFHAHLLGYDSGFAGVDVFFVISGYLITGILCSDLSHGRFSILSFYERRVRRILPALIFVICLSLPFAWVLMPPSAFDAFTQSAEAVSIFVSNIFFLRHNSYFDADASLLPLLHTWSLSVEEQFYIAFPVILWLVWRFGPRARLAVFSLIAIASFTLCVWGSYTHPSANFYLIPTRAWELLVGAIIGLTTRRVVGGASSNALSLVGLLAVIASMLLLHEHMRFPGFYALLPTVGTALVIYFATDGTVANKILSHPLLVRIGLVSYSAYLFHYPIFVFARFYFGSAPDFAQSISLIILTFVLAQLSWHLVERPFRDRAWLSRSTVLASGAGVLVATGMLAVALDRFDGFAVSRFGAEPVETVRYYQDMHEHGLAAAYRAECDFLDWSDETPRPSIDGSCTYAPAGMPVAFLWGDSHAQALSLGLRQVLSGRMFLAQVATSACPPSLDGLEGDPQTCPQSTQFALSEIERLKPDLVVMARQNKHETADWRRISDRLREIGVKRIVLVGPTPQWQPTLPETVAFQHDAIHGDRAGRLDHAILETDSALRKKLHGSSSPTYVSLIQRLCDTETCKFKLTAGSDHDLLVVDYGHLSPVGSEYVAGLIAKDILGAQPSAELSGQAQLLH